MRPLRYFIGALLAVLWTAPLGAQAPTGAVRGRVTDAATQQALSGVTVSVGSRSALTTADGGFAITGVPAGAETVRARMLGYAQATRPVTVAAGQAAVVDFAMTAQAVGLSEIVVTGYGEQRAGDITGAVTSVGTDEFNTGRIISPAQLIQSKVAGVQVVDNNEPGGGLSIRVRGNTSVNASSEPLYVVDGVPLGNGAGGGLSAGRDPLNFINPNDIENITVLRDASASSIYGSNAANGVVIITTRTGSGRQGAQFEYTGNLSMSSVDRMPSMMNGTQFTTAVQTYAPARVPSLLGQNTNWLDEVSQSASGQDHNLSISNSTGTMDYRLSLGYLNQDGVIQGSTAERFSLGANYNQRLFSDRLILRTNLRASRTADLFTPGGVLGNAAAMAPTQPVMDVSDSASFTGTGYWDWNTANASPSNPVARLALASDEGLTWRGLGSIRTEYQNLFVNGLNANLNFSYDVTQADREIFTPNNLADQIRQGQGQLILTNNSQSIATMETFLNYSPLRTVGPGTLTMVGGYSYNGSHAAYPRYEARGLSSNLLGPDGIPGAANTSNTKFVNDYKLISFFGRMNYNIGDRYLAAFSYRRDGSSRFGEGNQWGNFPSVAAAWRLSEESFLQSFESLSDLKLRASWARTGNQAFGDYLAYPTYTYSDGLTRVEFGQGNFINTIRPSAVDENIVWENTDSYDIGIDFGFSNQRFSGALDWYVRNTEDLIFTVPAPAGTTLADRVTTNIGSMRNSGFEFSLNARLKEARNRGLGWTATVVASHNTNELQSINPTRSVARILTGGISGGVGQQIQVMQPGSPVRSFYVYQHRTYTSANAPTPADVGRPVYTAGGVPDTAMYVDVNGDNIINDDDRSPLHDPAPKWILGFSNYFTRGGFDASFTLRAHLGSYVYNNVASSLGAYQNLTGSAMPSNLHTSVLETNYVVPQYYSDYYVEDASFLRMDNITLGYAFAYRGQPFRVFATIQNAFTITGYSGVDPTAGLNGIDNNIYPRARTFTTGLNVRF